MARFLRTNPETGKRLCSRCNQYVPLDQFHKVTRRGRTEHQSHCRPCDALRTKEARTALRHRVLDFYTDGAFRCAMCGESRYPVLDLDHIRGDGKAHRPIKGMGQYHAYKAADKERDRTRYRVLCRNCNWMTRWEDNGHV